jgi:hypothetical protein
MMDRIDRSPFGRAIGLAGIGMGLAFLMTIAVGPFVI